MKLINLKVKSSSAEFYTIIIEITDTIKVHCNCGAGIFGKLCKHKIAVLSGDSNILIDIKDKSILEEINGVISKSDFFNLNNLSSLLTKSSSTKTPPGPAVLS